jgi:hypothetical protein
MIKCLVDLSLINLFDLESSFPSTLSGFISGKNVLPNNYQPNYATEYTAINITFVYQCIYGTPYDLTRSNAATINRDSSDYDQRRR